MTNQRPMVAPRIPMDLDEAKRALRTEAIAARAGHDPLACGMALADHVLRERPPPPDAVVAGFWPLGDEIDIRPLLERLFARGHEIVLPVTPKRGNPLTFGLWRPNDVLLPERFGTFRPTGPARVPSYLLVPLLAFDRAGGRLGYGGGFYDRTLPLLPGRFAMGCGFAAQAVDAVPVGPYDVRLDAVATERGVMMCEG